MTSPHSQLGNNYAHPVNPGWWIAFALFWIATPLDLDLLPFGTLDDALIACLAYRKWLSAQDAAAQSCNSQIIEATLVDDRK